MLLQSLLKKYFLNFLRFLVFIFLIIVFFIGFLIITDFFKIKEIKVNNKNIIGINELKDNYLLFLNEESVKKRLLEKNPQIKDIQIKKQLPNTLIFNFILDQPIAILSIDNYYIYLSDDGKIILKSKKIENYKLPIINFYQKLIINDYQPGQNIDIKEIKKALMILKKFNELNIHINSLDINSVDMILFNLDDKKVYFSSDKEVEKQFYEFANIYRQFKIEGRNYKEIDLRFNKPIVRF